MTRILSLPIKPAFLLLLTLSLFSSSAYSTHSVGMEIYYTHIDSMKYEVVAHFYRYCGGSMLTGSATSSAGMASAVTVQYACPSTANSQSISLPVDTIFEVPSFCESQAYLTSCPPNGTWQTGLYGVLVGIYRDTVDFSAFSFQCPGMLIFNLCCRNTTTNLFAQPGQVVTTTFDPTAHNSSPQPLIGGFPFLYADGTNYDISLAGSDPDGDSLVYYIDTAVANYNSFIDAYTYVSYQTGYSGLQPISGISMNSGTAMTNFTGIIPQGYNAANYAIAWRVDEYDPNTQQFKGSSLRDLQFVVTDSTVNQNAQAPTITGINGGTFSGQTVYTCVNSTFCVKFTVSDPDTTDSLITSLFYDSTLMSLNVTATGTNPDTVTICGHAKQDLGYGASFVIHVADTACPFAGHTSATINLSTPCASSHDTVMGCLTVWDTVTTSADSLSQWSVLSGSAMNSSNFNCLNAACTQAEVSPQVNTVYAVANYNTNGSSVVDTVTVIVGPSVLAGHAEGPSSVPVAFSTVYLVQYDSLNDTVYAIDTTVTDNNGDFIFLINVDSFLVKVVPDFSSFPVFIPTYFSLSATVQSALFQTPAPCDTLSYTHDVLTGINLGGAGFVAGYVSQGAGRGVGDPVEDLDVILMDDSDDPVDWEVTDQNGYFKFGGLTAGTYRVFVDRWRIDNGEAAEITLEEGQLLDSLQFLLQPTWLELVKTTPESVEKLKQLGIHVYPNPTDGQFSIRGEGLEQLAGLTIRNLNGVTVHAARIQSAQVDVDISHLAAGYYLLELEDRAGERYNLSLVVQ